MAKLYWIALAFADVPNKVAILKMKWINNRTIDLYDCVGQDKAKARPQYW